MRASAAIFPKVFIIAVHEDVFCFAVGSGIESLGKGL
jgi:hypothetical protein